MYIIPDMFCLQELKRLVYKCLSKATESGHTSIAFPAIGTGQNKYPKEIVAKTMFSTIEQFQQQHTDTCLVDVRCIIYPSDTASLAAFVARCQRSSFGKLILDDMLTVGFIILRNTCTHRIQKMETINILYF